jgi:predicted enzyme related to lactoylglutathione lyase
MVHYEIPAGDTAKAKEFWGGLFGWEFQEYPGSPTEYHMTRFSETTGGAIYGADGDKRGTRTYFDVDDISAGAARVAELGGEVGEAMPVPSMGWFAICKDNQGTSSASGRRIRTPACSEAVGGGVGSRRPGRPVPRC